MSVESVILATQATSRAQSYTVVDFHTHLAWRDIYAERFLQEMVPEALRAPPHGDRFLKMALGDPLAQRQLEQAGQAGFCHSVILIIDTGVAFGEAPLEIDQIHEYLAQIAHSSGGKLSVFAGIDPRRGEPGFEIFRRSVTDFGFKGLKLYPPMGFSIRDSRLAQYYEFCAERHLPVLIHGGPSLRCLSHDYADIEQGVCLAESYPTMPVILAHSVGVLDPQQHYPRNFFCDLSAVDTAAGQEAATKGLAEILRAQRKHILFGSDWPLFNVTQGLAQQKNRIVSIVSRVNDEEEVDEILTDVLYRNALQILGMTTVSG